MKFTINIASAVVAFATAGSIVAAAPSFPHKHGRHHEDIQKRAVGTTTVVTVIGMTTVAYDVNGKFESESEVCKGIAEGSIVLRKGEELPLSCSSGTGSPRSNTLADTSKLAVTSTPTATASMVVAAQQPSSTSLSITSSSAVRTMDANRYYTATVSYSSDAASSTANSNGQGLEKEFPDGKIDCSEFPSDYGAIRVPWMGIGGWSGIQYPQIEGNFVTHIDTAVPGGNNCTAGAMCSYACPPGYQKSQWPSVQGSTGQSVGGLQCDRNNKLTLTNPELSKTLCIKGTGATKVKNQLKANAAICRTDYPGTEAETVPMDTTAGTTFPLTCPDSKTYFKHNGDPTTAQYYINNRGVALADACSWNVDGSGEGNWAPSFLGVGQDVFGKTWVSVGSTAQNNPKKYTPLDYTVEITGANLSGKCRLRDGKYCTGANYDDCNDKGCSVEVMSGEATYVLSEN